MFFLNTALHTPPAYQRVQRQPTIPASVPIRISERLNEGWKFTLQTDFNLTKLDPIPVGTAFSYIAKAGFSQGAASKQFDDKDWQSVNLPHDWAVTTEFSPKGSGSHGFKSIGKNFPNASIGWYRKVLPAFKLADGKRIQLRFEGVFRDSKVWLNGFYLGGHESGYSPFDFDITDYLSDKGPNVVAVRVDATEEEGWWYEGAGIYRNVSLLTTSPVHVEETKTFIRSTTEAMTTKLHIESETLNETPRASNLTLSYQVKDASGTIVASHESALGLVPPGGKRGGTTSLSLKNAHLWSPESPYLYALVTTVKSASKIVDQTTTTFGVRTLEWTANQGLLLNGKRVQIKGVCVHHDHAGVGTAIPDELHEWRLKQLKTMGVNGIRMSHNAITPTFLDLCDRMGFLVLCENREYGINPHQVDQARDQIIRNRNHPSVFVWSLGNEEWGIEGNPLGAKITRTLQQRIQDADPTRKHTVAISGGWGVGSSTEIEVMGFNYFTHGSVDAYHKQFPTRPSIATEDGATFATRGVYVEDKAHGHLTAYDTNKADWNTLAEESVKFYTARPFVAGQFQWTGFDYRGEPTPFGWPNIASHFGIMDLCGFPKDTFYYYQAWWTNKPVLHILPHWNWLGKEGVPIKVWVQGNDDEVELLLNGKSLGRKVMPRLGHLEWEVPFQPGRLAARGYRKGIIRAEAAVTTTGPAVALKVEPQYQGGLCIARISAVDAQGREVPTADNLVKFDVLSGRLLGVGNGDPSSLEADQIPQRSLFNGLAQVIFTADKQCIFSAEAEGLRSASILFIPTRNRKP